MTRRARLVAGGAVLLLATLAAYAPALRGGFLWDDDAHVTGPELRSPAGLARIWLEPSATQQYYPLTHSAFWVQWWLWGESTTGYHVVNVLLHVLSAVLAWSALRRLGVPGAAVAAALFALHPVHVESVAWITELKNTLSGTLYLAALLAYLRFDPPDAPDDAPRSPARYALASALFLAALLAKTVTATLPAALLLIHWFKRGRLSWRRHAAPLCPWLAAGAALGLTTAWIERTVIGARGEAFDLSVLERVLLAGRVVWFYAGKLAWPMDLVFIYPRWSVESWSPAAAVYPATALALVAVLWALRRRIGRGPVAAVLFFAGSLFPVLGFFNVYPFKFSYVADHFQYLPSLGIFALVAAAGAKLATRAGPRGRAAAAAACVAVLAVLGTLTFRQSRIYRSAEVLWVDTTTRSPEAFMAFNNLGYTYGVAGRLDDAERAYRRAIEIKPDFAQAHFNLGRLYGRQGRHGDAVRQYRRALAIDPGFAQAHYNLGLEHGAIGRHDLALRAFRAAAAADPGFAEAHYNAGSALGRLGRHDEAVAAFDAALAARPDYPEAWLNRGVALAALGRDDEAVAAYRAALETNPDSVEAWHNLALAEARRRRAAEAARAHVRAGTLLGRRGRYDEAVRELRAAVDQAPGDPEARYKLGAAWARSGRAAEAREAWQTTLRLDPDGRHGRLARASLASLAAAAPEEPGTGSGTDARPAPEPRRPPIAPYGIL